MSNTQQAKKQLQQLIAQGAVIHYPNPTYKKELIKKTEELAQKLLDFAQELREREK